MGGVYSSGREGGTNGSTGSKTQKTVKPSVFEVKITLPPGKDVVSVLVSSTDTVYYLKRRIQNGYLHKIDSDHLSLEFRGQKLDDSKRLSEYDLEEGDMLQIKSSAPTQNIFVKTINGVVKDIVDVSPFETVGEFAEKIYLHMGLPVDQVRLVYAGQQLDFSKRILDYGLVEGSTVHVVLRNRGD